MILVASDFDGTLAHKGWPTEENKQAVATFRRRGGKFGVVSGRHYSIACDLPHVIGGIDFLICCTGALIIDGEGQVLYHKVAPVDDTVREVVMAAKAFGAKGFGVGYLREYVTLDLTKEDPLADCPLTEYDHNNCIFYRDEDAAAFIAYLKEKQGEAFNGYQNGWNVDMPPVGCSKVEGIRIYLEGFEGATLYTVGDNHNDIPMLKAFPSYAVESGVPEAKSAADRVCQSVAEMLEELLPGTALQ